MKTNAPFVALVAWMSACQQPEGGPTPLWDPSGDALFDAPFPSNTRLSSDGIVSYEGFPNPGSVPLIATYINAANTLEGFGTNSPVFLRFAAEIDTALLPTPEESLAEGSPVLFVDVDPESPHWGERVPVQWEYTTTATAYKPPNLLAVAPVFGFPLRPNTTYALVVTTTLASPAPGFEEVWQDDHPDHPIYMPLQDALFFLGLSERDVSIATVFTTGDPLWEMAHISTFLHEDVAPATLGQELTLAKDYDYFKVYTGSYWGPLFQHGERPYATEGGGFEFRDDGMPIIYEWEDMRIAVCTPIDLSNPPTSGWPVVIQQHGTGGNYMSHCQSDSSMEIAAQLGSVGLVSIGIDEPLHGTRATEDTEPDVHSFNYLNPESARANFQQGALDAVYLAHSLSSQTTLFTTDDGKEIPLDKDQVFFFGHSHGGLTGALATPFFGEDVSAAVISGAGGAMSITIVERKDPVDISSYIEALAQFSEGEELTELHPLSALVQHLVDVTDPINYSPFWFATEGYWEGQRPVSVLETSGLLDIFTPPRTAEALAAAARLPQISPPPNNPEVFALRHLDPEPLPLTANLPAFDGTQVTAAFSQWPNNDHFAVFDNADLADIYRNFLATAAEGEPTLESGE